MRNVSTPARIAIVCVAVCLGGARLGMFRGWQLFWLDIQYEFREVVRSDKKREALHSPTIALVTVDAESAVGWKHRSPLPRDHLAQVVRQLKAAGARTIVLDVLLDSPAEDDDELAAAVHDAGNVVIPFRIDEPLPGRCRARLPQTKYQKAARAMGVAAVERDDDSCVRRMRPRMRIGGKEYVFVSLVAVAEFLGRDAGRAAEAFERRWASPMRGLTGDNSVLINFVRPAAENREQRMGWPTFSSKWVATGFLNPLFKDKLVLIGATLEDQPDVFLVPLWRDWLTGSSRQWAGVEILTQVANMELLGMGLRIPLHALLVLPLLCACAVLAWVTFTRGFVPGAAVGTALAAVSVVTSLVFFCKFARVVDATIPLATLVLTFVVAAYRYRSEEAHRRALEAERAEAERRRIAQLAESRDMVMKTIVHDLKVPITIIKGEAMTLLRDTEGQLGEEIREEFLETMAQQCDRLTDEIDDLLDTDPHRQITLRREPVELRTLAEEVMKRQEVYARHHDLRLEADGNLPRIMGDKAKLARILTNLVNNAIKYSPDGGAVDVTLRRADGGVEVSVRDHGIGISPEQRARLFKLFERVVDPEHNIPGTGVGLFSVKRLVEAHGGTIDVESTPGEGSRFYFRIPGAAAANGQ